MRGRPPASLSRRSRSTWPGPPSRALTSSAGVMISAASSRVRISAPWAARSAAKLRRWPRSYSYRAAT